MELVASGADGQCRPFRNVPRENRKLRPRMRICHRNNTGETWITQQPSSMGNGGSQEKILVPQRTVPGPCCSSERGGRGGWASRTQKHSEAGYGRPVDRGAWTAKTVKRPRQQPAHPQYANYWAPLTRKRHTTPHSAQPRHTNHWALRTRKRHQQEHRPQRPTESSAPTQHAKGRTGHCPGPRKGATTRRNVTQGGAGGRQTQTT